LTRSSGPPCARIFGFALRPIGVSTVITFVQRSLSTGHASRMRLLSSGSGIWPVSRPQRIVGCVGATSNAMSPPECAAPTTSVAPSCSCAGLR
jgi:hypothetical protein